MATPKIDKYADYRYEIQSETELAEAEWLIKQGDFKNLDDYINCMTQSEIRRMEQECREENSKFRGSLDLTDKQYKDFQLHAKDIRNEWG